MKYPQTLDCYGERIYFIEQLILRTNISFIETLDCEL